MRTDSKKYFLITYGCQANVRDSETIAGLMLDNCYLEAEDIASANVIIINTCAIRQTAEEKLYGKLGFLKHLKDINKEIIIGITGCIAQDKSNGLLKAFPWVDFVVGTSNLNHISDYVKRASNNREKLVNTELNTSILVKSEQFLPVHRFSKISANITIMHGCDNFCSYCIVPYVRGREVSRACNDIINEIKQAELSGYKEIVLLGQNVNSYRMENKNGFIDLLKNVLEQTNIPRVRFMTSHPKDFDQEIIALIDDNERLCPHIHLPVQSGSNIILDRMNRKYTREEYLFIIEKIKKNPNISVTSDIIVGFPGETEVAFRDTLELVKNVEFDSIYTFIFSPREGTKAAVFPDQVVNEEKKSRLQRLMDIQYPISLKLNKNMLGRKEKILVEGYSKNNKEMLTGRTIQNKIANFAGSIQLTGEIVDVMIRNVKTWSLEAEII